MFTSWTTALTIECKACCFTNNSFWSSSSFTDNITNSFLYNYSQVSIKLFMKKPIQRQVLRAVTVGNICPQRQKYKWRYFVIRSTKGSTIQVKIVIIIHKYRILGGYWMPHLHGRYHDNISCFMYFMSVSLPKQNIYHDLSCLELGRLAILCFCAVVWKWWLKLKILHYFHSQEQHFHNIGPLVTINMYVSVFYGTKTPIN